LEGAIDLDDDDDDDDDDEHCLLNNCCYKPRFNCEYKD
jgi:hypothetical protein